MDLPHEVIVVGNPAAGRGRSRSAGDAVVRQLADHGIEHRIEYPSDRVAAATKLTSLAAEGTRTLVVGGDGMVHLAVNAFAGSSTPLGIIAAGTGNDFAGALALPTNTPEAVDAALGDPAPVDLLRVGGSGPHVATVATLGFSAAVNERAEKMRFPRGSSRYTVATLLEVARLEAHSLELTVDGTTTSHRAVLVAVANTATFGGGMQ
ncbi:MAG: diacylglycerol kinase family protein, partial [Actinomycetota bacterium]|nr:diacylglycerol kinase family protein [Actinomycetota bacterium]